ncbi:conserved hypothetical protein [Desulfamplus magnetovallimortis]|uniref:Cytoplasmic protein n=1 Tax=Desulfamplus magnetovallimortis TaxID=1246637 RepID=A0A1W1HD41_9BACT|nr:DUF1788 domain-containing protein [Desulfamplus magnetovallimortis]SLM30312.1 conserved hypothetical protein [Desulfamplus magnetovallimortis]
MAPFKDRLNKILDRLTSDELLSNSGLGNEIGFYIFDYPAENELEMREHIQFLLSQLPKRKPDIRLQHINLFELIVEYLKNRKLLDRVLDIQQKKGNDAVLKAIKGPLDAKKIAKEFVDLAKPEEQDLVLVSGVGSAYPMLRSHNVLGNLHHLMGDTPLVLFYPGIFTGQGLSLFGKLKESNYYRAFQLVPQ